jgi:uncharacterized protein YycO
MALPFLRGLGQEFLMRFLSVHGLGFVSKLIEWQTRGYDSHSALLFSDDTVIESRERHYDRLTGTHKSGVEKLSFADWKLVNPGIKFRIFYVETTPEQEANIRAFAEAQVGKPYSYLGVLRFITRQDYQNQPDDAWWCSEIVFQAFLAGPVVLFKLTEGWEVSPQLLPRSPLARLLPVIP